MRIPLHIRDDVDKEVTKLVRMGVLTESDSEWATPIVAMRKRGSQEVRITQDFHEINKLVPTPQYPLPQTIDLIERMAGIQPNYLTKFDLKSGYFQIPLKKEDQKITAF